MPKPKQSKGSIQESAEIPVVVANVEAKAPTVAPVASKPVKGSDHIISDTVIDPTIPDVDSTNPFIDFFVKQKRKIKKKLLAIETYKAKQSQGLAINPDQGRLVLDEEIYKGQVAGIDSWMKQLEELAKDYTITPVSSSSSSSSPVETPSASVSAPSVPSASTVATPVVDPVESEELIKQRIADEVLRIIKVFHVHDKLKHEPSADFLAYFTFSVFQATDPFKSFDAKLKESVDLVMKYLNGSDEIIVKDMTYKDMENYVNKYVDSLSSNKKKAVAPAASADPIINTEPVAEVTTDAVAEPVASNEKKERRSKKSKPKADSTDAASAPAPAPVVEAVATPVEANGDAKERPRRQKKEKTESEVKVPSDSAAAKPKNGGSAVAVPSADAIAAAAPEKKKDSKKRYAAYESYNAANIAAAARGNGQKNPQIIMKQAADGSFSLLAFCDDWPAGEKGHQLVTDKGSIKAEVFNIGLKHRALRGKFSTLVDLKAALLAKPFELTEAELTALEIYSRDNKQCIPK